MHRSAISFVFFLFLSIINTAYAAQQDEAISAKKIALKHVEKVEGGDISKIQQMFTSGDRIVGVSLEGKTTHLLTFQLDDNDQIQLLDKSTFENIGDIYDVSADAQWIVYSSANDDELASNSLHFLHWSEAGNNWQFSFSSPIMENTSKFDFSFHREWPVSFSEQDNFITIKSSLSENNPAEFKIYRFNSDLKSLTLVKTISETDYNDLSYMTAVYIDEPNSALIVVNTFGENPTVPDVVIFHFDLATYELSSPFSSNVNEGEFNQYSAYDAKNRRIFYGESIAVYQEIDFAQRQFVTLSEDYLGYSRQIKLRDDLLIYPYTGHNSVASSFVKRLVHGRSVILKRFDYPAQFALTENHVWVQEGDTLQVYFVDRSQESWSLELVDTVVDGELTSPYFDSNELYDEEKHLIYRTRKSGVSTYNILDKSFSFKSWQELGMPLERYSSELAVIDHRAVILLEDTELLLLPAVNEQGQLAVSSVPLFPQTENLGCESFRVSPNSPFLAASCYDGSDWFQFVFKMQDDLTFIHLKVELDIFPYDPLVSAWIKDIWSNNIVFSLRSGINGLTYPDQLVSLSNDNDSIQVQAVTEVDDWNFGGKYRFVKDNDLFEVLLTSDSLTLHQIHSNGETPLLSEYSLSERQSSYYFNVAYLEDNHLLVAGLLVERQNTSKLIKIDPQTYALTEVVMANAAGNSISGSASFIPSVSGAAKARVFVSSTNQLDIYQIGHSPDITNFPEQLVLNEGADDITLTTWVSDVDENDSLSYSSSNLPSELTLTDDGFIKIAVPEIRSGMFNISVEDSFNLELDIPVNYLFNYKPVFQMIPSIEVDVGETITSQLSNFASDVEQQTLSFSSENITAGLILTSDGNLSGVVRNSGAFSFEVVATDPLGNSAATTVNITVKQKPSGGSVDYFLVLIMMLVVRNLYVKALIP